MCGRYTLTAELGELEARFDFQSPDVPYTPSYNIAPSQSVLAVLDNGAYRAEYLRWGLVPSWAKDPSIGARMINARAETLADKPSFRQALRKRRCLILADGFYEWQRRGKTKQPMYISLQEHRSFAFAGLWEVWRDAAGTPMYTCTIVTTTANPLLQPIHDRMPVILDPSAEAVWLDSGVTTPQELLPLLQPYKAAAMQAYAVSTEVNVPGNNAPSCIIPVHRDASGT